MWLNVSFSVANEKSAYGLLNNNNMVCSCNPVQKSNNSEQELWISASIFRDFFLFFFGRNDFIFKVD